MHEASLFDRMLAPVGVEHFFEAYWEQRALYLDRQGAPLLPFRFGLSEYFALLPALKEVKMTFRDSAGQHREAPIQAKDAPMHFAAGRSICANELDQYHDGVRALTEGLDRAYWHADTFRVNSYLSPANKGFGLHFDNHSVWILQLEGSKLWRFSDAPAVPYPLTNLNWPVDHTEVELAWYRIRKPDTSTFHEVLMKQGDVLYLPAGAWHETIAQGSEHSLSFTLGQKPVFAAKFITEFLKHKSYQAVSGRRFLPGSLKAARDGGRAEEALKAAFADYLETLRRMLDETTADELYRAWKQKVLSKPSVTKVPPVSPLIRAIMERRQVAAAK